MEDSLGSSHLEGELLVAEDTVGIWGTCALRVESMFTGPHSGTCERRPSCPQIKCLVGLVVCMQHSNICLALQ